MIVTLRTTSVIVVILAVMVTAFGIFLGGRGEKASAGVFELPLVVEAFKNSKSARKKGAMDEKSPLVKQAEAFALFLDPPAPPKRRKAKKKSKPSPRHTPRVSHRPERVQANFELLATSYFSQNPDLSLALIDEPGKGAYWIKPAEKVGHLVIKEIKDGIIVVKDSERTFELAPKLPERKSLLKDAGISLKSGKPALKSTISSLKTPEKSVEKKSAAKRPAEKVSGETSSQPKQSQPPSGATQPSKPSPQRKAELLQEIMNRLEKKRADSAGVKRKHSLDDMRKVLMGKKEAKRLEELGEKLGGQSVPDANSSTKVELSEVGKKAPGSD